MQKFKTVSINELEKSTKGPVWVLNQTTGKSKGDVIFICSKLSGSGTDTIKVPMTFIPINLTEQVTRRQLVESSEFRRSISIGLLTAIDIESAEKLLRQPGVSEEKRRLMNEKMLIEPDTAREEVHMHMADGSSEPDENGKIDGVTAVVVAMCDNIEDKQQVEIANTLRTLESELTTKDYGYVRSRAISAGYKKLARFCKDAIEENIRAA